MQRSNNLPPVIRVFLSSTFADMQNERNYFSMFVQPKLRAMCEERGVSFFSVDLRWGITEEDQINDKVLPICLSEIDKCRPYFIGIIGNRYGSIVHKITDNMQNTIPWLEGKAGKSITELEMLYGALDREINSKIGNCAFYIRDSKLSESLFPHEESEPEGLVRLKETITQNPEIHSARYDSVEKFGELILKDFTVWLDTQYPSADVAADARKHWYNAELLRNYISFPEMKSFLDYYIENDNKPLMVFGEGKRGKTAFLTNWAMNNERCLLVNCRSDTDFNYWPSIARDIINQLTSIEPDVKYPEFEASASMFFSLFGNGRLNASDDKEKQSSKAKSKNNIYLVTDEERNSFREGFVDWVSTVKLKEPICIVINDLEILDDGEARLLTWMPAVLPENVHIICSCNDPEIVDNAEVLGWNTKEMPLFSGKRAEAFLELHLKDFGKNLSSAQKKAVLDSPLAVYPGWLKYIVHFLNCFGAFEVLPEMTAHISSINKMTDMYSYSFDYLLKEFSSEEKTSFLRLLAYLRCNRDALHEQDYYSLLSADVSVTAILWSRFRTVLEQLDIVNGEYCEINDQDLCKFIDSADIEYNSVELALGRFYLHRLHGEKEQTPLDEIRRGTENAKYALRHLKASDDSAALCEGLSDKKVLFFLCKVDWHIERSGWMHLLLHSDIDVPAAIERAINDNKSDLRDSKLICMRLARLVPDLEFRSLAPHFSELMGTEINGELNVMGDRSYSHEFLKIYQTAARYKNSYSFEQVIRVVESALRENENYSARERSYLLFLKADAEINLKLNKDCLSTCAEHYSVAIQTADLTLITEALLIYSNTLYALQSYKDAEKYIEKTKRYALLNGYMRPYLSASNIEGLRCYHLGLFDASEKEYRLCSDMWKKVGNIREFSATSINLSNLKYASGNIEEALCIANDTVEILKTDSYEGSKALIPQIMINIGKMKLENGDPSGEDILLQLLHQKDGHYDITSEISIRSYLGMYYEKKDMGIKAAEQYERLSKIHFDRREFDFTIRNLQCLFRCLKRKRYDDRYRRVYAEWEEAFSKIPHGLEYLRKKLSEETVNPLKIASLEEQLVVAKSEEDKRKEADLLLSIADEINESDITKKLSCLTNAAKLYQQLDDEASCRHIAEYGIFILFSECDCPDMSKLDGFVSLLPDDEREMVQQWIQLRTLSASLDKKYVENDCAAYQELTEKILASDYVTMVARIISDQLSSVLSYGKDGIAESVYEAFKGNNFALNVINAAIERLSDDSVADINALCRNYLGQRAERLIRKLDNLIVLLQLTESSDLAALAGNLALIYRRIKNKEKTLYYHNLSLQFYKDSGMTHDYLIEMMNVATAYKEFEMFTEFFQQLRAALAEAKSSGERIIEAAISGNLAAKLFESPEFCISDNEILELFEIEESVFLEEKEYREYVISLINQFRYLKSLPNPPIALMREKVFAAREYVLKYSLSDFQSIIRQMEQDLNNLEQTDDADSTREKKLTDSLKAFLRRKGKETADDGDPVTKSVLTQLIEKQGDFIINQWELQEPEESRALCLPKDEVKTARINLRLSVHKEPVADYYRANFMYIFSPVLVHKDASENIIKYIEWWNDYSGLYSLNFDKDNMVVYTVNDFYGSDVEQLLAVFKRLCKLCYIDLMNVSMAAIGLDDLQMLIQLKTEALNNDENAD